MEVFFVDMPLSEVCLGLWVGAGSSGGSLWYGMTALILEGWCTPYQDVHVLKGWSAPLQDYHDQGGWSDPLLVALIQVTWVGQLVDPYDLYPCLCQYLCLLCPYLW